MIRHAADSSNTNPALFNQPIAGNIRSEMLTGPRRTPRHSYQFYQAKARVDYELSNRRPGTQVRAMSTRSNQTVDMMQPLCRYRTNARIRIYPRSTGTAAAEIWACTHLELCVAATTSMTKPAKHFVFVSARSAAASPSLHSAIKALVGNHAAKDNTYAIFGNIEY